jgi:hypothetical protein
MTRRVKLALAFLPLLATWLGGCTVIYDDHYYHHPRYGYYGYYR